MLDKLTHEDFKQYVNETFCIHYDEAGELEVQLVRAEVVGKPHKEGIRDPFSVVFSSPLKDRYLVQGTYRFSHEKMGDLELFITPLGPTTNGMSYEAVFS